ncbi:hypothetical protein MC885_004606 [Smutsia gigantea]|nr:hypothetical protein MC885_004606 [Smutsia gigantea]
MDHHLSMCILSSCCKMSNILEEGITSEVGACAEKPPTKNSLAVTHKVEKTPLCRTPKLLKTSTNGESPSPAWRPLFAESHGEGAHRSESLCPVPLFNELGRSHVAKVLKMLKEIHLAFLPYEAQNLQTLLFLRVQGEDTTAGGAGPGIVTRCTTLQEYPAIRYRKGHGPASHDVLAMLNAFKVDTQNLGKGPEKPARSY